MTALTRNIPRIFEIGDDPYFPAADNVIVYEGSAVGDDGTGYCRSLVAGDQFRGFCVKSADNTLAGHAAGGVLIRLRIVGKVEVPVSGAVAGDIGKPVYASDDNTFTYTAAGNSFVGRVIRFVSSGNVLVAFNSTRGGLGMLASITDGSGGTANDATGIGSVGGAYSQTVIANAIATLTAKINALTAMISK